MRPGLKWIHYYIDPISYAYEVSTSIYALAAIFTYPVS